MTLFGHFYTPFSFFVCFKSTATDPLPSFPSLTSRSLTIGQTIAACLWRQHSLSRHDGQSEGRHQTHRMRQLRRSRNKMDYILLAYTVPSFTTTTEPSIELQQQQPRFAHSYSQSVSTERAVRARRRSVSYSSFGELRSCLSKSGCGPIVATSRGRREFSHSGRL